MKKLLILYGRSDWRRNVPFEDEKYKKCYEYFYSLARKHGLEIYRASYKWYDFKKKIFKNAWTHKKNKWVRMHNIKPDIIHDKTKSRLELHYFKERLANDFKIINDPEFTLLADNKFYTSLIFPKYFKRYYKVRNKQDVLDVLKATKGNKVVVKPAHGSGGEDVKIVGKKDIEKIRISGSFIAQEFVDSSAGIKGIAKGVHDLRIVFVNNEIVYAYIREPARGKLLANVAQGGTMTIVKRKNIPKSVEPIIERIQDVFRFYEPKIYTVDLIFDKKQNPWVVELNTMPGMYFYQDQKKQMDRFYLKLVKVFKET